MKSLIVETQLFPFVSLIHGIQDQTCRYLEDKQTEDKQLELQYKVKQVTLLHQ